MSAAAVAPPPWIDALPKRIAADAPAVATAGLTKRYGRRMALRDVDVTVPDGAVYLLAGANGAGKTSLLRILQELVRPTAGSARVLGIDPAADGAAVRARTGYVPERPDAPYGFLRVGRLVAHHAAHYPGWDPAYARHLSQRLEIEAEPRFEQLSKGQARRVQLLLALAYRPRLLLLDEPTDGLDPLVRDTVLELLAEHLADHPATVLVSTHLVGEVERLADHVGVLTGGRLLTQASRADLRRLFRRYHFEAPAGHSTLGVGALHVAQRTHGGGEHAWTVWGEEAEVIAHLSAAGARIRQVRPLGLEEAVVALLRAGKAAP